MCFSYIKNIFTHFPFICYKKSKQYFLVYFLKFLFVWFTSKTGWAFFFQRRIAYEKMKTKRKMLERVKNQSFFYFHIKFSCFFPIKLDQLLGRNLKAYTFDKGCLIFKQWFWKFGPLTIKKLPNHLMMYFFTVWQPWICFKNAICVWKLKISPNFRRLCV